MEQVERQMQASEKQDEVAFATGQCTVGLHFIRNL